jgi:hypothetical protein
MLNFVLFKIYDEIEDNVMGGQCGTRGTRECKVARRIHVLGKPRPIKKNSVKICVEKPNVK